MASQFIGGLCLQYATPAYLLVSGNASGVTPKVSGWNLVDAESLALTLATGSGTAVTWTAKVSDFADGREAIGLPDPPTWPTGNAQSASVVVTMPTGYRYLQLTATPSAGSSTVTATPTLVTGRPVKANHSKTLALSFHCASTATLAGQASWEMSPNYSPRSAQIGTLPVNTVADPALWVPGVDSSNTASTVAALVTSTGQDIPKRLGQFEFPAIRAKLAITSGFGAGLGYRVFANAKG